MQYLIIFFKKYINIKKKIFFKESKKYQKYFYFFNSLILLIKNKNYSLKINILITKKKNIFFNSKNKFNIY